MTFSFFETCTALIIFNRIYLIIITIINHYCCYQYFCFPNTAQIHQPKNIQTQKENKQMVKQRISKDNSTLKSDHSSQSPKQSSSPLLSAREMRKNEQIFRMIERREKAEQKK